MTEPVANLTKADVVAALEPKTIPTPKEMPVDPFEFGEKLNAAYQKGWADAKATIFEVLKTQKEMSEPKKKGFLE